MCWMTGVDLADSLEGEREASLDWLEVWRARLLASRLIRGSSRTGGDIMQR